MSELNEAGGVAFTDVYTPEGHRVSITARATTINDAIDQLVAGIKHAEKWHLYASRKIQAVKQPATPPTPKVVPTNPQPKTQKVQQAPPPSPDDEEFPFDYQMYEAEAHAENMDVDTTGAVAIAGRDWGLVDKYPPKASELGFGDRFEILVHEYNYKDGQMRFYVDGSQYPAVTHNMTAEYPRKKFDELFNNWKPTEDGENHVIKGDVILAIQCTGSDKQTSKKNPYQNLDGARKP